MTWLPMVGIGVGYLIIGLVGTGIALGVMARFDTIPPTSWTKVDVRKDEPWSVLSVLFWPVTWPVVLIGIVIVCAVPICIIVMRRCAWLIVRRKAVVFHALEKLNGRAP